MEAKIKSIVKSIAWKYFGTALYIIAIVAELVLAPSTTDC